jgi:hypothetical protein
MVAAVFLLHYQDTLLIDCVLISDFQEHVI